MKALVCSRPQLVKDRRKNGRNAIILAILGAVLLLGLILNVALWLQHRGTNIFLDVALGMVAFLCFGRVRRIRMIARIDEGVRDLTCIQDATGGQWAKWHDLAYDNVTYTND